MSGAQSNSKATASKTAAQNEADSTPVEVDHGGVHYTIPPTSEWSVDVFEAAEDGKATIALRTVLGPDQWQAFKDTGPTLADIGELFDLIAEATGLGKSGS